MENTSCGKRAWGRRGAYLSLISLLGLVLLFAACNSGLQERPYEEAEGEIGLLASYEDLLKELVGFGKNTTGGKGGKLIEVTNLNDSGSGSLRNAISQKGPKWIVFKKGLSGTIRLRSILNVSANTTIDGRGANVTISGYPVVVRGDHGGNNVIITHLKFDGSNDDAIRIMNGARNVWIHRNSLTNAKDGLIDIVRGPRAITVSWNRFSNHGKSMLIGYDRLPGDKEITVTIHHNYFHKTNERHPRLARGKVHFFNNHLHDWRMVGPRVSFGAELYSEANIYEAGSRKRVSNFDSKNPGYLKSVNDSLVNGAFHAHTGSNRVFNPSSHYNYSAGAANSNLKSQLAKSAGWQSVSRP